MVWETCVQYKYDSTCSRVIPKTQKMVLDATLPNTQNYKVRIKDKVEQSLKRSCTLPYTVVAIEKETFWSPSTSVVNFLTLSRRLTMHFSDTSSMAQHLKRHSCHTTKFRKILTKNTTILQQKNCKQKLQILEALHIRNKHSKLNRNNFESLRSTTWLHLPIRTRIHTHTHKHTYIHTHIYTHIHTHTHTYIYTHIHTHICIHIHTRIHTHIHTHTQIHTHIHTYAYTGIYIYIW